MSSGLRIAGIIILTLIAAFVVFTLFYKGFDIPLVLILVIVLICLFMVVTGRSGR